jgi:hypothetical protein
MPEEPGEIMVLPQPITIATDVDDVTIMDQAIDECCRHHIISEDLAQPPNPLLLVRIVAGCS